VEKECERLVGCAHLGFGGLRAKLRGRQPIFGDFQARLDFRQSSGSAFQFFFGIRDEVTLPLLDFLRPRFGAANPAARYRRATERGPRSHAHARATKFLVASSRDVHRTARRRG
jgi:hypothetical protein